MPEITAAQCARYWLDNHGPANRAVEFVAIAMSESSLRIDAVSPVGALGTWQIMPFWFDHFGYAPADYQLQDVQAVITVAISGLGTNCAAWDSCYQDINRTGRYTFLAWPEQGSAAYANIPVAEAETGMGSTGVPDHQAYPGVAATIEGTLSDFTTVSARAMPALSLQAARQAARISRMFYGSSGR